MNSLRHISLETWARVLYSRRECLGHRSWECWTLLDLVKFLPKEDSTVFFLPPAVWEFLYLHTEESDFCSERITLVIKYKVSWVDVGGGGATGAQTHGSQEIGQPSLSFWAKKLGVTTFCRRCCPHSPLYSWAGKSGMVGRSSVINQMADCVGNQTSILCRKLVFIFYWTKLKAERVLRCALLWRACFLSFGWAQAVCYACVVLQMWSKWSRDMKLILWSVFLFCCHNNQCSWSKEKIRIVLKVFTPCILHPALLFIAIISVFNICLRRVNCYWFLPDGFSAPLSNLVLLLTLTFPVVLNRKEEGVWVRCLMTSWLLMFTPSFFSPVLRAKVRTLG